MIVTGGGGGGGGGRGGGEGGGGGGDDDAGDRGERHQQTGLGAKHSLCFLRDQQFECFLINSLFPLILEFSQHQHSDILLC